MTHRLGAAVVVREGAPAAAPTPRPAGPSGRGTQDPPWGMILPGVIFQGPTRIAHAPVYGFPRTPGALETRAGCRELYVSGAPGTGLPGHLPTLTPGCPRPVAGASGNTSAIPGDPLRDLSPGPAPGPKGVPMAHNWGTSTRKSRLPANWRRIRRLVLERDRTCVLCRVRPSSVADHKQAMTDDHRLEALQGMCEPCHRQKTAKEAAAARAASTRPGRKRPAEGHPGLL